MADTKEYFVRMAVLTDVLVQAKSKEQAMDLAEEKVRNSMLMPSNDRPLEIDIINVVCEDER